MNTIPKSKQWLASGIIIGLIAFVGFHLEKQPTPKTLEFPTKKRDSEPQVAHKDPIWTTVPRHITAEESRSATLPPRQGAGFIVPKNTMFFDSGVRVVDAITLATPSWRIRLADLEAPALDQLCHENNGRRWMCGQHARAALYKLVQHMGVSCVPVTQISSDMIIGQCWTHTARTLNEEMIISGWATPVRAQREQYHEAIMQRCRQQGDKISSYALCPDFRASQ